MLVQQNMTQRARGRNGNWILNKVHGKRERKFGLLFFLSNRSNKEMRQILILQIITKYSRIVNCRQMRVYYHTLHPGP